MRQILLEPWSSTEPRPLVLVDAGTHLALRCWRAPNGNCREDCAAFALRQITAGGQAVFCLALRKGTAALGVVAGSGDVAQA